LRQDIAALNFASRDHASRLIDKDVMLARRYLSCAIVLAALCNGCAVPRFDVPVTSTGQPTVETIVNRIQCELKDIVRDDRPHDAAWGEGTWLLTGDYDVSIALSLDVNNTGGLTPTLSYMTPISKVASFMFGGSATLSEGRDHNFTENIQLTVRKIYTDWKNWKEGKGGIPYNCPLANTNLAGTLGIVDYVAMAFQTSNLAEGTASSAPSKCSVSNQPPKSSQPPQSPFGGSIQFLVTKNVTGVGPTWTLVHFKGPGGLVGLSQVNTDKITLGFAQGPYAGCPIPSVNIRNPLNLTAYNLMQQILTSSINQQLIQLQNTLLPNTFP
jgi:hypothetical protein